MFIFLKNILCVIKKYIFQLVKNLSGWQINKIKIYLPQSLVDKVGVRSCSLLSTHAIYVGGLHQLWSSRLLLTLSCMMRSMNVLNQVCSIVQIYITWPLRCSHLFVVQIFKLVLLAVLEKNCIASSLYKITPLDFIVFLTYFMLHLKTHLKVRMIM